MSTSGAKVDPRTAQAPAAPSTASKGPAMAGAARPALADSLFGDDADEPQRTLTPVPSPRTPVPEQSRAPRPAGATPNPEQSRVPGAPSATAKAAAARMAAPLVTWPRNVPAPAEALTLLTGQRQDPSSNGVLAALRKELAPAEQKSIAATDPFAATLRQAVVMRLRLALALERKPAPGVKFEDAGVEKLLAEADTVLGTLQPPEGANAELQAGFGSARAALARDAVALSEFARVSRDAAAKLEKAERAARAAAAPKQAVQSMTVDGGAETRGPPRTLWMGIALAVLLLGAGAYHGAQWRDQNNFVPTPSGLPTGAYGRVDPRTGLGSFRVVDPRLTPAKLAEFRKEIEGKGMVLKDLGNGVYVIAAGDTPSPTPR